MDKFSFNDVFTNSFLEGFSSNVSILSVIITLFLTFVLGLFIYFVYKKTFQGVMYAKTFNISLVMISMITSLVIMAVTSNIVLSLGMVGALSIVRFRTAVKDPMDIVFMFWAISVGIVNGAGLFLISILGSLIIGVTLIWTIKFDKFGTPYLLIVNYKSTDSEMEIMDYLNKRFKKYMIRSKIMSESVELTVELRIDNNEISFINDIYKINDVVNATLVSYNGDYAE